MSSSTPTKKWWADVCGRISSQRRKFSRGKVKNKMGTKGLFILLLDAGPTFSMLAREKERERGFGRWALIILLQLGRDLISIMSPSDCQELSELDLDCGRSKSIAAQLGRVPGVDNAPSHFLLSPCFFFSFGSRPKERKMQEQQLAPQMDRNSLSLSLLLVQRYGLP